MGHYTKDGNEPKKIIDKNGGNSNRKLKRSYDSLLEFFLVVLSVTSNDHRLLSHNEVRELYDLSNNMQFASALRPENSKNLLPGTLKQDIFYLLQAMQDALAHGKNRSTFLNCIFEKDYEILLGHLVCANAYVNASSSKLMDLSKLTTSLSHPLDSINELKSIFSVHNKDKSAADYIDEIILKADKLDSRLLFRDEVNDLCLLRLKYQEILSDKAFTIPLCLLGMQNSLNLFHMQLDNVSLKQADGAWNDESKKSLSLELQSSYKLLHNSIMRFQKLKFIPDNYRNVLRKASEDVINNLYAESHWHIKSNLSISAISPHVKLSVINGLHLFMSSSGGDQHSVLENHQERLDVLLGLLKNKKVNGQTKRLNILSGLLKNKKTNESTKQIDKLGKELRLKLASILKEKNAYKKTKYAYGLDLTLSIVYSLIKKLAKGRDDCMEDLEIMLKQANDQCDSANDQCDSFIVKQRIDFILNKAKLIKKHTNSVYMDDFIKDFQDKILNRFGVYSFFDEEILYSFLNLLELNILAIDYCLSKNTEYNSKKVPILLDGLRRLVVDMEYNLEYMYYEVLFSKLERVLVDNFEEVTPLNEFELTDETCDLIAKRLKFIVKVSSLLFPDKYNDLSGSSDALFCILKNVKKHDVYFMYNVTHFTMKFLPEMINEFQAIKSSFDSSERVNSSKSKKLSSLSNQIGLYVNPSFKNLFLENLKSCNKSVDDSIQLDSFCGLIGELLSQIKDFKSYTLEENKLGYASTLRDRIIMKGSHYFSIEIQSLVSAEFEVFNEADLTKNDNRLNEVLDNLIVLEKNIDRYNEDMNSLANIDNPYELKLDTEEFGFYYKNKDNNVNSGRIKDEVVILSNAIGKIIQDISVSIQDSTKSKSEDIIKEEDVPDVMTENATDESESSMFEDAESDIFEDAKDDIDAFFYNIDRLQQNVASSKDMYEFMSGANKKYGFKCQDALTLVSRNIIDKLYVCDIAKCNKLILILDELNSIDSKINVITVSRFDHLSVSNAIAAGCDLSEVSELVLRRDLKKLLNEVPYEIFQDVNLLLDQEGTSYDELLNKVKAKLIDHKIFPASIQGSDNTNVYIIDLLYRANLCFQALEFVMEVMQNDDNSSEKLQECINRLEVMKKAVFNQELVNRSTVKKKFE